MRGALALLLALLAPAAQAQSCAARVNAQELIIVPEAFDAPSPGVRERLLMWPSRTWDRAWGERVTCDSATVATFLAATMQLDQTEGYCLAADEAEGWLLVPGVANFRGRCTRTACQRVEAATDGAVDVGRSILGLATGREIASGGDAVVAVAHGTGAFLVTGQAPAVASALGQAGAWVAGALGTTAALGAGAVTVVAAGGALYLCSGDGPAG